MPGQRPRSNAKLANLVRTVHTAIWFAVEANVVYLFYAGIAGRTGRGVDVAATIVAVETGVFTLFGFRCPLTQVVRRLGEEQAGVTDIFLPKAFARALPALHVPLLLAIVILYVRNRRRALTRPEPASAP